MNSHLQQFEYFARYNRWFNGQIFDCVERLSPADRERDMGAFFGSIEATLDHLLLVDRIWLGRVAASPLPFPSLDHADLVSEFDNLAFRLNDDFDSLRAGRHETDDVIEAWVRELTVEGLEEILRYHNSKGVASEMALWHVASHLFNHQAHHRGQVTTLLSQLGVDVGITDFIVAAHLPKT